MGTTCPESLRSYDTIRYEMLLGHFTLWKKNPYTEGLLCLLLHSEGTAIFYVD